MRRRHWICRAEKCGKMMTRASSSYMICSCGYSKMSALWSVRDLVLAKRVDYKRFKIGGLPGHWEYVPNAHNGCLERAPEVEHIVAKVEVGRYHQAMTFRPTDPPRKRA